MITVEAPAVFVTKDPTYYHIFLAGGITNCPDWQSQMLKVLEPFNNRLVCYNPRRANFPIHDPNASLEQIKWEYEQLKNSDLIIFWFASGSINPIVLYELGKWGTSSNRPIIVGCDPAYERIRDVQIQFKLARPFEDVFTNFDEFKTAVVRKVYDHVGTGDINLYI